MSPIPAPASPRITSTASRFWRSRRVNFGDHSYLKSELSPKEFYRLLSESEHLPTTSQPTPAQFLQAYERAAAEGADEIIAVCVTSKLSGTLTSAVMAAEDSPVKVHVWDTEHVTDRGGLAGHRCGRDGAGGVDPREEILARLAPIRASMFLAITPANLRFLIASGRVPKLRGAVGELLNIRPIITAVERWAGADRPGARAAPQPRSDAGTRMEAAGG